MIDAKAWLQRYRELCTEIDADVERAELLRQRIETAQGPSLDGMPHSPGYTGDRIGTVLARIEEIESRTRRRIQEAATICAEIESAVAQITGKYSSHRRAVLLMRYIDFFTWAQINRALFGSSPEFELREDSYLRRVTKTHQSALKDLQTILNAGEQKEENT